MTVKLVSCFSFDLCEIGGAAKSVDACRWDQQTGKATTFDDVPFCQDNGSPTVPPIFTRKLDTSEPFQALPEPHVICSCSLTPQTQSGDFKPYSIRDRRRNPLLIEGSRNLPNRRHHSRGQRLV